MAKLKLGAIEDDKPVKLTVELPAAVHRDLMAYGEVLGREAVQVAIEPARLIAPIVARFMSTDRTFAKARRLIPKLSKRDSEGGFPNRRVSDSRWRAQEVRHAHSTSG